MKKVGFILLLSALWFKGQASNCYRTSLPIESSDTGNVKKIIYAEMIWQVSYTVEKLWVNGKTVSQEVKSKVAAAKYRDLALEVMGDDGWELASTVTRNIDAGFEIFFYFKKSGN